MIKFQHSIFALPFAYLGAFLAEMKFPGLKTLFWITLAMVGARSFAMAANRLIDARDRPAEPEDSRESIAERASLCFECHHLFSGEPWGFSARRL